MAGRGVARQLRVSAQMARILSDLLRLEVKDPRLSDVSISEVDLSGDLGVAKVYFSLLNPDADPKPAMAGFDKASGFLRSRVGAVLQLRRVPELRFIPDSKVKDAMELSELIDAQRASARTVD